MFGKKREPIPATIRNFLEQIIDHSNFRNLTGNKREDKIYDLKEELLQLQTVNIAQVLGTQKYKVYTDFLDRGQIEQANQYVLQQIPDFYGSFYMSLIQQLADKYSRPSADDLLHGSR